MVKFPQGRDDLRQAWSQKGPQGRTWGATEKRGDGSSPLGFDNGLSPHSVCKKSPNLLAALLPLPDLSLKQCLKPETMLEVGAALCWKGWVLGQSGLRKNA